jgi:hypothetical protein
VGYISLEIMHYFNLFDVNILKHRKNFCLKLIFSKIRESSLNDIYVISLILIINYQYKNKLGVNFGNRLILFMQENSQECHTAIVFISLNSTSTSNA